MEHGLAEFSHWKPSDGLMFTEYGPEIKWVHVASSCIHEQIKYNYILYFEVSF